MKRLVVFDLDGTLAPSKAAPDAEMSALLHDLLGIVRVAVISGGDWEQFEAQLLAGLPDHGRLANLSLLPTCGTQFFEYAGGWAKLYSEDLTPDEKAKIISSLDQALGSSGFKSDKTRGEVIEDRGSQGNDYPAEQAGVVSIPVRGPSETKLVIRAIAACLDGGQDRAPTAATGAR